MTVHLEDHEPRIQPLTYRFGPFMLDTNRQMLLSGVSSKPLPEKVFRILVLLLEAGGRLVDKDTFFREVWHDDDVSDANLTQHIFMLRQLLGESARENAYVITVGGKGYRFAVPIEAKLGLAMKGSCERCGAATPALSPAMMCSYECTFCVDCAADLQHVCPNCGGELVARPRRETS
jgi:DNA-binding winged helix-turn-helix (wHTH) protein